MVSRLQVLWLLLSGLLLAAPAYASRRFRPMGDYIREAALIVVGDTARGTDEQRRFSTIVTVTAVLKGDPAEAGKELVLGMTMSTADARVPVPAKGIAILLRPGWRDAQQWPVLEAYAKPEEVTAVRTLIAVYQQPTERQQLVVLREHALGGDQLCRTQLLADLRNMREPANFDLLTDLYDVLTPPDQLKLIETIALTNDLRGVPTLLKAMQSPDPAVRSRAAGYLSFHYAGAPGVTAAFEQAQQQPDLAPFAVRYLQRHGAATANPAAPAETPWAQATRLWDAGPSAEARAAFLAIVDDPKANSYARCWAAERLLPGVTPTEKDHIRAALLPWLTTAAAGDNYLEAETAVRILRGLRHADCLPALLPALPRTDHLYRRSARLATLAVKELGADAARQGVARLLADLAPNATKLQMSDALAIYLLELVWLGGEAAYNDAAKVRSAPPETVASALRSLFPLGAQPDEGAFLCQCLALPQPFPVEIRDWLIFRLGELHEQRAIPLLVKALDSESEYGAVQTIAGALVQVGGADVEAAMMKLLTHPNRDLVRPAAIEVLFRLQGARARELAQRMLREQDLGLPQPAIIHLGNVGTAEDLPLLLPYCDYWKGDRTWQYWALQAVGTLRERCHYDVNGPIPPPPAPAAR